LVTILAAGLLGAALNPRITVVRALRQVCSSSPSGSRLRRRRVPREEGRYDKVAFA
jgi:hypothetical protein